MLAALRWWRMPFGLLLPATWLLGTGLLAAQRLLYAQAGLPWNTLLLALPWIAVGALAAWRLWAERRANGLGFASVPQKWARQTRQERLAMFIEITVALLIAVFTASMIKRTLNQPLAGWDALVMWIFKGRVLYQTGTLPLNYFTDPHYAVFAHLDYPQLVPLSVARIYSWTGDQEVLVKVWWALLAGVACAGLYFGLSGLISRAVRIAGLVMLVGLPALMTYGADGLVGYAELPLAVYFLFAAIFLYRWQSKPTAADFGLSAFFFALVGTVKNEGLVVALAGFGILVGLALLRKEFARSRAWVAAVPFGLVLLPWQIEKWVVGIKGDLEPTIGAILANWQDRLDVVLRNLIFYASDISVYNVIWLMVPLLVVSVLIFKPRRWLAALPLLLVVLAQVAGTVAAFLATPHDLTWHLGTAAARLVFQPVLVLLLLGTIYIGMLLEPSTSHEEARLDVSQPIAEPVG